MDELMTVAEFGRYVTGLEQARLAQGVHLAEQSTRNTRAAVAASTASEFRVAVLAAYKKARKAAQRADMDAEYDSTNPAGW